MMTGVESDRSQGDFAGKSNNTWVTVSHDELATGYNLKKRGSCKVKKGIVLTKLRDTLHYLLTWTKNNFCATVTTFIFKLTAIPSCLNELISARWNSWSLFVVFCGVFENNSSNDVNSGAFSRASSCMFHNYSRLHKERGQRLAGFACLSSLLQCPAWSEVSGSLLPPSVGILKFPSNFITFHF